MFEDAIVAYATGLRQLLCRLPFQEIDELIAVLLDARARSKTIFLMGNGGSGSTASHLATDLGKGTAQPGRPRHRIITLNDCQPLFSAYANDFGYETVFAEPLRAFVTHGDVVIGLSTSGNSRNVLEAMKLAREAGALRIGFTGFDGGQLRDLLQLELHVPSDHIGQVEDAHLMMVHLICDIIRQHPHDTLYTLPAWLESSR